MSAPPGPPQVVVPGAGWVDVAARAITQVGFPVVIAGVLLWFLLTRFQANMDTITTRMGNNTQVVATLIDQERSTVEELKRQTELMREMALNSEKLVELRHAEMEGKRP